MSLKYRFARIESHYFVNGGFIEEGSLTKRENIDKIRHIPTVIVQGRYDVVCPMKTAWDLHKVFPEAEFVSCLFIRFLLALRLLTYTSA